MKLKEEIGIPFIKPLSFFHYTGVLKELLLLEAIENNKNITQLELSKIINVVPSMINQYIKKLEEQQYLKKEIKSSRNMSYQITDGGRKRKQYLLMTYMYELSHLYHLARDHFEKVFQRIDQIGKQKLYLYGAGEVSETVIAFLNGRSVSRFSVIGIFDDDEHKQGQKLLGYPIMAPHPQRLSEAELILITSFTFEQQIRDKLAELQVPSRKVLGLFREILQG